MAGLARPEGAGKPPLDRRQEADLRVLTMRHHYPHPLILAACALAALPTASTAQPAQKITIGIYAPTVEFGAAQARLAYVQDLARAIGQATGLPAEAQSYANIAALKKDAVDFAIIDGVCYAANLGWK